MGDYTYSLSIARETEFQVDENHFGGNVIGNGKNDVPSLEDSISDDASSSYFQDAIEALGVTHLRYPAGKAEEANITELINDQLNSELSGFIDY